MCTLFFQSTDRTADSCCGSNSFHLISFTSWIIRMCVRCGMVLWIFIRIAWYRWNRKTCECKCVCSFFSQLDLFLYYVHFNHILKEHFQVLHYWSIQSIVCIQTASQAAIMCVSVFFLIVRILIQFECSPVLFNFLFISSNVLYLYIACSEWVR